MNRSTLASFAASAALAALFSANAVLAQPAANANPRAFKGGLSAECERMREDYLERRGQHDRSDKQAQKDARKAFKERCGESKEMDDDERAESRDRPPTLPPVIATAPPRCDDIHARLRDALARKASCGRDLSCRLSSENAYEKARNAWRREGCGELPGDARRPRR